MTIGERIKHLRKDILNTTQAEFAKRINIGQSNLAHVECGRVSATGRVIKTICKEFGLSEKWLRTGEGEMFHTPTTDEELALFLGEVLDESDGSFKKRLLSALSKLTTEQWEVLEDIANNLNPKKDGE